MDEGLRGDIYVPGQFSQWGSNLGLINKGPMEEFVLNQAKRPRTKGKSRG